LYYLISFYLKLGKIVIVKEGNSPVKWRVFLYTYIPLIIFTFKILTQSDHLKKFQIYFWPIAIYGIQSRCIISLVFFILKLGKIVIVKEEKLSSKMESFLVLYPIEFDL
jgi:hypothetical protein